MSNDRAGVRRAPTLQGRIAGLAVATAVALVLAVIVSAVAVTGWSDAVDERRERRLAVSDSVAVQLAVEDEEVSVLRYAETADPVDLAAYDAAVRTADLALGRLTGSASHHQVVAAATAAREAIVAWRTQWLEPTLGAGRGTGVPVAGAAGDVTTMGTARAEVDAALLELDTVVHADQLAADDRADSRRTLAIATLVSSIAVVVALISASSVLVRRWAVRPLTLLSASSRQLARGEIDGLPRFTTREFTTLADAITQVDRERSDERDRAARAYDTLNQNAVLALHVRQELVRHHAPAPPGWSLAAVLRPAEGSVAGDCYDVGLLDPGTVYLIVIDVTGHGATAALAALGAKSVLRAAVRAGASPGDAMSWLIRQPAEARPSEYLTAIVAVVDVATGRVAYANAGHPPAIVVGDGDPIALDATGPIVGPIDTTWATESVDIPDGGALLLYSDGVLDVVGPGRDRLGEQRLRERIGTSERSAESLVAAVEGLVDGYATEPLSDDVTVLALSRAGHGNVP